MGSNAFDPNINSIKQYQTVISIAWLSLDMQFNFYYDKE